MRRLHFWRRNSYGFGFAFAWLRDSSENMCASFAVRKYSRLHYGEENERNLIAMIFPYPTFQVSEHNKLISLTKLLFFLAECF